MKYFSFLDLDPRAVGDWMARSMTKDEAESAIDAVYKWILSVRESHLASRWKREGDAE